MSGETSFTHVRDLASLDDLSEEGMLSCLQQRYNGNFIYTYLGDILVAVNPFTSLDIYGAPDQQYYGLDAADDHLAVPHTFAVAAKAYRALVSFNKNQCIIVNGESGAGKTESSKQIAKQIIYLCAAGTEGSTLEQKILQVNPVLEAFGNAQTLLNNNSSRFGKYMELLFNTAGKLQGATITDYLLEKSRVSHQIPNEQNFHVLYYVFEMEGAGDLGLDSPEEFKYLQNKRMDIDEEDFEENCEGVVNAFKFIGFSDQDIESIKRVLACVLHLGNVTFNDFGDTVEVSQEGMNALEQVASILLIEAPEIVSALTVNIVHTKSESIPRHYKLHEARDARDSMAKLLYSRMFGWIIFHINKVLCTDEIKSAFNDPKESKKLYQGIGILDIFGFEQFNENGFEQFCINLANEQLQHIFNRHVFELEHEEYRLEGIDASDVQFTDNDKLIGMFLDMGLFSLLDEETIRPQGNSSALVRKFSNKFNGGEYYVPSRGDAPVFMIRHFAADVKYTALEFIKKNRDSCPHGVTDALESSSLELISDLVTGSIEDNGFIPGGAKSSAGNISFSNSPSYKKKRRRATVAAYFKKSLTRLVSKLSICEPHFVRCIKPNMSKAPYSFTRDLVLNQLRYTGMMATVKIRKEGYAWRPLFADFIYKFKLLAFGWKMSPPNTADSVRKILAKANITKGFQIGKTKVFLKYYHEETLFSAMHDFQVAAKALQKVVRGHISRKQLEQRKAESKTQEQQVSAFFALISLLGDRAHERTENAKASDHMKQQEEEAKRVREQARIEAEKELLTQIEQLEEERQVQAHETEEMIRLAEEAEKKRQEAEEELEKQRAEVERERISRQQALIEAERRIQEEAEKAEQERNAILEELEEARKVQEDQRRAMMEAQLFAQQAQREAEEKAQAAAREKEEAVLLEQKEWQTLVSQITVARDQAEEELSHLKSDHDLTKLRVDELQLQLQDALAELDNETVLREELETRLADSNEGYARESMMRVNIERAQRALQDQNRSLKKALIAAEDTNQRLKSQMKQEVDRRRTMDQKYQFLEIEKARLEANANIMGTKAFKERQEELKLKIERARALRQLARGAGGTIVNKKFADLKAHLASSFTTFPDESLVVVEQYRMLGYLQKQGEVNSGFKKRFFVLDLPKHVFHYRTDPKATSIKGIIEIKQMIFVSPGADSDTVFIVGTPRRNFVMMAPNEQVRDVWIEALRLCLGDIGRKMTSNEHALQAESLRVDYELRLSTMKAHIKKIELQLENERIKRVDADLRASRASKQRDDAIETKTMIEEEANRKLIQQRHATIKALDKDFDPELEAIKSGIQRVVHKRGAVNNADLQNANIVALLKKQLIGAVPADVVLSATAMEGFLTKLGGFNKSWKKRWFSLDLRRCTLSYLANENATKILGHIDLSEIVEVVVPTTPDAVAHNTLLVVTLSRTYQFRAATKQLMHTWTTALNAIAEGNHGKKDSN